ncbi:hypothetical protein G3I75_27435 [Pseudomonas aeruginosa]|nr:hypothetical protein G3I75_27435 [Pseudomonas aeruginosa]
MDGVHQARGEVEVVEAGLAFLRFDHEVFQLPVVHRLRLAFAARLVAARLGVPAFFGGGFGGLFAFLGLFSGARGAGLVVGARGRGLRGRFSVGFSPVGAVPFAVAPAGPCGTGEEPLCGWVPSALPKIFLSALSTAIS